jgi:hypothetical protein
LKSPRPNNARFTPKAGVNGDERMSAEANSVREPSQQGTLNAFERWIRMPQHETERVRAERLFKVRERQKADAPKATADYYAAQQALRDRTRELRQLRLARDAEKKHGSIG